MRQPGGGEILTWLGKPAPPMPMTPAILTRSTIAASSARLQSMGGIGSAARSSPSASSTALKTVRPAGPIFGSMARMVPDVGAWTTDPTKAPASAMSCPRRTWSPTATIVFEGAPMFWWSDTKRGSAVRMDAGSGSMGSAAVRSLQEGGWTPPWRWYCCFSTRIIASYCRAISTSRTSDTVTFPFPLHSLQKVTESIPLWVTVFPLTQLPIPLTRPDT